MQDIDSKLKTLKPILGMKKVMKLRMMYYFEDDFRAKREIENRIDLLISTKVKTDINDQIILPPPAEEHCSGDIYLGDVEYLGKSICPFHLKLKDLNRHMGIFGSTGSGKTTLAINLIRKLHNKGLPFMIFDWETSYRSLVREFKDVEVLTVGKDIHPLHLNILDVPPGISKDEYAKSLISLLAEDYLSGAGSDSVLLNYIKLAYQENAEPNFEDLKEITLREIKKDMKGKGRLAGRSGLWKETVQRIIYFLSIGASGSVLNSRANYPLDKLFKKNVVLEFGNIQSPRDRKFFIHCIINWLFLWLQHNGIESEKLKQIMILEEFHNLTMKGSEDNLISLLFRQVRKYGLGLIAIDQTPSEIPNPIYANMNSKISFTLTTAKDISAMARAMNLDFKKAEFLGMLKTGAAIVNIRQRHDESFLLRVPFTNEDGYLADEELKSAMRVFSSELSSSHPIKSDLGSYQTSQEMEEHPPLAPLEKVLLSNIIEKSIDSVQDRTKTLGLHPSEMVNLQTSLIRKGYIKTAYVDRKKLIELTQSGKNAATEAGLTVSNRKTRGGIEHYYWIDKTRQFLKNIEFQPVLEFQNIDITVPKYGIAIEVETGKSNIIENVLKLDKSRFTRCFMLATNKIADIKITNKSINFPNITSIHIKDFLRLTKGQILNPLSIPSRSTQSKEVMLQKT